MPRCAVSWPDPRRCLRTAVVVVGAVFGVVSELVGFGWGAPGRWVPDLVVGLAFLGAGAWAWPVARGSAVLLWGTGVAWFAANLLPGALFWHRAVLVHLLLTFPGWRPRSRVAGVGVVLGYVVAAYPRWWSETVTLTSAGVLLALLAWEYAQAVGHARRHRRLALGCGLVFAGVLGVGAVARFSVLGGSAVTPALWLYEGALCAVAVGLVANVRRDPASAVTDLVVELGETRSGPLRDALARTLGDPSLSIGYRQAASGRYVDAAGAPLEVPDGDPARSVRYLERDGHPFAVLVHDPAVLSDPALVAAVTAATELTAANAALHAEVRAQLAEVAASRRRLLRAADEQRHRLEERLHDGPRRRLAGVREALAAVEDRTVAGGKHLPRARAQLDQTLDELDDLARGLHPRDLAGGLAAALRALVARSPVPVRLAVPGDRFAAEIEAAMYFVAAEALANVAKHASASSASIDVRRDDSSLTVVVADDGAGGAVPRRGLIGLADRVQALGGRLRVESPPGGGTTLTAYLPLERA